MDNRRLYGYIVISIGFIAVYVLVAIYKIKSPWYELNFYPPDDYVRGPLSNDQGNNI